MKHLIAGFAMLCAASAMSQAASAQVVAVVIELTNGRTMFGSAIARDNGVGTFSFSGGGLRCRGRYDAFDPSTNISVVFRCNRGVTGTASLSRTRDTSSGLGSIAFSNGWRGRVGFTD
jgi:hypothetical protein